MSLPEMIALLVFYAIVLGVFLLAIYHFTIRPMRKPVDVKTRVPDATPSSQPASEPNQRLLALLRDLESERIVPTEPQTTQQQLAVQTETLPTFNEICARAVPDFARHVPGSAVRANTATVERTLTVQELQANTQAPVLLPLDKSLLPEGLRTLEVSPNRTIEPGMTVYAAFTFRNLGGAAASGFRVRFGLPIELTYVAGSARIDGTALEDRDGQTPFVQQSGADIGEIPAGGERRLSLAYRVAEILEDGSPVLLQAAIASPFVPAIGTNIVRLTVHSSPILQTDATALTLSSVNEAQPGQELRVNARIHNSGQSTAHDVAALLPLPAHTAFVPNSAMVGGRLFTPEAPSQDTGSARRIMAAPTLEPGETIDMGYRVRIDLPLEDATVIAAAGMVCSQEIGQFPLPSASITIASAASFEGEETSVRLDCSDEVKPGDVIRIIGCAKNVGTAVARGLALTVALPDGLSYIAGSLTIDATATVDFQPTTGTIQLADLAPGDSIFVALCINVRSPIADGHQLRVVSSIAWSKGKREFERTITARSAPRFPLTFNKIDRESASRVTPADSLAYTLTLHNLGTDVATDAMLQVSADAGIEQLRLHDRNNEIALGSDGAVDLGTIRPGTSRSFRVDGRVASVIADQTVLALQAALSTAQTARIELAPVVHVVDSAPRFSPATSRIAVESDQPLEHRGVVRARLIVTNEGTDRGSAVRIAMLLSDELRLERINGDTCKDGMVEFGDIPAGETREAELQLRLVGGVTGDRLRIAARLNAANQMAVNLEPVEIETHAEPSFEGTTLTTVPLGNVNAGGEITYMLSMRNSGNGTARRVTARLTSLSDAVYAHASTTVNGIALQDQTGTSLLLSPEGLTLADVAPGVEAVVRWRAIVNTPLPPATLIACVVSVQWDGGREISLSAQPLGVHSTSAMPVFEPSLPFSILGAVAASKDATALAIPTSRGEFIEVQSATRRRAG